MTNKKIVLLKRKDDYYVNIDKYIFENLTRRQVAFICLIDKLNKTNLIATNAEIGTYLGINAKYIKRMIENINKKHPNLIKIKYDTIINHVGKIQKADPNHIYSKGRSIHLTKPLHTKNEEYVNLPNFSVTKKSQFLSGNELKVLNYIKAMPEKSFSGFLRVISKKLDLSLGIIKRALEKLAKVKAIFKRFVPRLQKLKNIYYTVNIISLNSNWLYIHNPMDDPITIKKKRRQKYQEEESWNDLLNAIGDYKKNN